MIQKDHISLELAKFGQQHLLDFYDNLTDEQQDFLLKDIQNIDFSEVCNAFEKSNPKNVNKHEAIDSLLEPLSADIHQSIATTSRVDLKKFRDIGKILLYTL